jgi:hypothetical protein|tara:strand:+ start:337 stop:582 length:246 start_codon:yes stop_codon:yes gene_type:complete
LANALVFTSAFLISIGQAFELKVMRVTDNVFAIVTQHEQHNADNFVNNATFGVVVTGDGIVLVDSGGSYRGAEQIAGSDSG